MAPRAYSPYGLGLAGARAAGARPGDWRLETGDRGSRGGRSPSAAPRIGFDPIGDVFKVIGAPVGLVLDPIGKLVAKVPGASWVGDAFNQGQTWLRDMANDPWGGEVLGWISDGLGVAALAVPGAGPLVATFMWSVPDYLRNECATEAYVKELANRTVKIIDALAQAAGAGQDITIPSAVLKQAYTLINDTDFTFLVNRGAVADGRSALGAAGQSMSTSDVLAHMPIAPESRFPNCKGKFRTATDLATCFAARPDAVALAMNLLLCERIYDVSTFDPLAGTPPGPPPNPLDQPAAGHNPTTFVRVPQPLPAGATAQDVLLAILDAERQGIPDRNLDLLKKQYAALFAAESKGAALPTPRAAPTDAVSMVASGFKTPTGGVLSDTAGAIDAIRTLKKVGTVALLTAPIWAALLFVRSTPT